MCLQAGGFIGHAALVRQREGGLRKKLVQFLLDDHDINADPWPWGGEPIYRNGVYCGTTTSTAFGFTLNKHVCLGYVQNVDPLSGAAGLVDNSFITDKSARFEVDIAGKRFPAKANIHPPKMAPVNVLAMQ